MPNQTLALTEIGVPRDFKPRPKGSEIVLVHFKVIECFKGVKEAEGVLKRSVPLHKHTACGDGVAHILMEEDSSMIAGEDHTFRNNNTIPYIVYTPEIYSEQGHFKVKPHIQKNMAENVNEVTLRLSKVIQDHVKTSVAVVVSHARLGEQTTYYAEDQAYVNQIPQVKQRVMTDSETLKVGESKIISGNMWVEGMQKKNNILPEYSRVWLELTIK